MAPGKPEGQEFEYKRHGTQCFMINFEVATGRVVEPSYGYTRTEEDFVNHIKRTVESDLSSIRWHFVTDNLNTHKSALVIVSANKLRRQPGPGIPSALAGSVSGQGSREDPPDLAPSQTSHWALSQRISLLP